MCPVFFVQLDDPPPDARNMAFDPMWMRYHSVSNRGMEEFQKFLNGEAVGTNPPNVGNRLYKEEMNTTDPYWITNTFEKTEHLFRSAPPSFQSLSSEISLVRQSEVFYRVMARYLNESLLRDARFEYASEKYPWILAAARYPHVAKLPTDGDIINMRIPARARPGHYIAYYKWKGYSDCVDVDLFDTDVEYIDGRNEDAWVWNKVSVFYFHSVRLCLKRGSQVLRCFFFMSGARLCFRCASFSLG